MTDPIEIESPQAEINRVRFAGKDFFTFVDDMVARIQLLFVTEFNDFVASGTGVMLIDMVAWAAETLSFYIDRQASESYLATARLRRSVNRIVRQLGYKMAPAVSSSVDTEVNLTKVYAFGVTIPTGFKMLGPSGLIFEATEDVTFPAGEGPASPSRTVSIREGITRTETFTSNGSRNQVFRLNPGAGKFFAAGTASVTVGAAPWTESQFITFDETDQYEIDFNSSPPLLRFGDGVAGNIPPIGDGISVTYVANSGAGGLVLANEITRVSSPLVVAFQAIPLTITHANPTSGGADPESLESAKANAPLFFKARNVAVTQSDYIGLSQAFVDPLAGAVAVAQAFVARGADDDLTLQILLDSIRAIVDPIETDVTVETTAARASAVSGQANVATVSARVTTVTSKLNTIATNPTLVTASGLAITVRDNAEAARTAVNDIAQQVIDGKADVDASAATAPQKASIKAFFDGINTDATSVRTNSNAIITTSGAIETEVLDANTAVASINVAVPALSVNLAAILVNLDNIDTLMSVQFDTAIETELQAIFDHVDGFLAADCQANLVQVPILTKDVDGFLVEPSITLQRSLQTYLEARKEVTQVVEVMSGGPFLVRADIVGRIAVVPGFVTATVLSNVQKRIDDLLRDRAFGASLRLSDVYTIVEPDPQTGVGGVVGVRYAIFEITGPVLKVDGDGNLIITKQEVITKGALTLTPETPLP